LKERAARRGAHPRGPDGGDSQTESSTEEGFRQRKTGEVDAWAMGTKARSSGVDGRDKWRAGEEKDRPAAGGSILRGAAGMGARRGGRRVEAERKRERERGGGPGCSVEQRSDVSSVRQRPGRGARGHRVAARHWRTVRSARRGGQVGRGATGPVVSGWVRHGEAVGAALTGGVGSTVCPIRFSNRIKWISNGFKFALNFD
jgi:hypothetical protein